MKTGFEEAFEHMGNPKEEPFNLGNWKFLFERWKNYASIGTFIASTSTAIFLMHISWWWFILAIIASFALIIFVDIPYIAGKEYEAGLKVNPEWNRMVKMIEEMHKGRE